MKVVFHIGTYKTGTSTIQLALRENADLMLSNGIYYPPSPSQRLRNQHAEIVEWITVGAWDKVALYINDSINFAKENNAEVIVFSSEGFSSLNQKQVTRLYALLPGVDVEVVVYFRNVYDYILSTLCQLMKSPNKTLFTGRLIKQVASRLNFDAIVNIWESEQSKVIVQSFEKYKKTLIQSFLSILDVKIELVGQANRNIGFSLHQTLFLVLSGAISDHASHEKLHKEYFRKRNGVKQNTTMQELLIAKLIFDSFDITFTHKSLKMIESELLELDLTKFQDTSLIAMDNKLLLNVVEEMSL